MEYLQGSKSDSACAKSLNRYLSLVYKKDPSQFFRLVRTLIHRPDCDWSHPFGQNSVDLLYQVTHVTNLERGVRPDDAHRVFDTLKISDGNTKIFIHTYPDKDPKLYSLIIDHQDKQAIAEPLRYVITIPYDRDGYRFPTLTPEESAQRSSDYLARFLEIPNNHYDLEQCEGRINTALRTGFSQRDYANLKEYIVAMEKYLEEHKQLQATELTNVSKLTIQMFSDLQTNLEALPLLIGLTHLWSSDWVQENEASLNIHGFLRLHPPQIKDVNTSLLRHVRRFAGLHLTSAGFDTLEDHSLKEVQQLSSEERIINQFGTQATPGGFLTLHRMIGLLELDEQDKWYQLENPENNFAQAYDEYVNKLHQRVQQYEQELAGEENHFGLLRSIIQNWESLAYQEKEYFLEQSLQENGIFYHYWEEAGSLFDSVSRLQTVTDVFIPWLAAQPDRLLLLQSLLTRTASLGDILQQGNTILYQHTISREILTSLLSRWDSLPIPIKQMIMQRSLWDNTVFSAHWDHIAKGLENDENLMAVSSTLIPALLQQQETQFFIHLLFSLMEKNSLAKNLLASDMLRMRNFPAVDEVINFDDILARLDERHILAAKGRRFAAVESVVAPGLPWPVDPDRYPLSEQGIIPRDYVHKIIEQQKIVHSDSIAIIEKAYNDQENIIQQITHMPTASQFGRARYQLFQPESGAVAENTYPQIILNQDTIDPSKASRTVTGQVVLAPAITQTSFSFPFVINESGVQVEQLKTILDEQDYSTMMGAILAQVYEKRILFTHLRRVWEKKLRIVPAATFGTSDLAKGKLQQEAPGELSSPVALDEITLARLEAELRHYDSEDMIDALVSAYSDTEAYNQFKIKEAEDYIITPVAHEDPKSYWLTWQDAVFPLAYNLNMSEEEYIKKIMKERNLETFAIFRFINPEEEWNRVDSFQPFTDTKLQLLSEKQGLTRKAHYRILPYEAFPSLSNAFRALSAGWGTYYAAFISLNQQGEPEGYTRYITFVGPTE